MTKIKLSDAVGNCPCLVAVRIDGFGSVGLDKNNTAWFHATLNGQEVLLGMTILTVGRLSDMACARGVMGDDCYIYFFAIKAGESEKYTVLSEFEYAERLIEYGFEKSSNNESDSPVVLKMDILKLALKGMLVERTHGAVLPDARVFSYNDIVSLLDKSMHR